MKLSKRYWSINQAIEKAAKLGIDVSSPTLIKWCREFNLGFQLGGIGGKWYVYPDKFMRYLDGGNPENQKHKFSEQ